MLLLRGQIEPDSCQAIGHSSRGVLIRLTLSSKEGTKQLLIEYVVAEG